MPLAAVAPVLTSVSATGNRYLLSSGDVDLWLCFVTLRHYFFSQDHRLWPMSPVKPGLSDTSGPSILDMEFSDEDDDDYEPSKDVEVVYMVFVFCFGR